MVLGHFRDSKKLNFFEQERCCKFLQKKFEDVRNLRSDLESTAKTNSVSRSLLLSQRLKLLEKARWWSQAKTLLPLPPPFHTEFSL
jgi:hypothetical protein